MKKLSQLYEEHQGKLSDKWSLYLAVYDRLFLDYVDKEINLLEIGVQNGGSLEIWAKYFDKARNIVGLDIDERCANLKFEDKRISVLISDVNSENIYEKIYNSYGSFDVIIDDGSHASGDIIRAFGRLFRLLKPGGVYVVEDLHFSYWSHFDGSLYSDLSAVAFFKRLVDILNFEHWRLDKPRWSHFEPFVRKYGLYISDIDLWTVHSIEFFNSMCVIKKDFPNKNGLGLRVIAGQHEFFTIRLKDHDRTSISDIVAPVELDKENDLCGLKEGVGGIIVQENSVQKLVSNCSMGSEYIARQKVSLSSQKLTLQYEVHTLRNILESFRLANNVSQQIIQDSSTALHKIYSSRSWRLVQKLRSLRLLLFPQGSWRERLGKKLYQMIVKMWKFMKYVQWFINSHKIPSVERTDHQANYQLVDRFDEKLGELSKYEVVSFDVFDTSIVRLLYKPTDLFLYLGFILGDPSFAERRVQAEMEARRKSPERDIKLTDIYANLPQYSMQQELEAELSFCLVNPEVRDVYDRLISHSKKVWFISDVYLAADFVKELLKNAGYLGYERLMVSSEDYLIKGDGSRFDWLNRNFPTETKSMIHVGDNQVSDYVQPRNHGIQSLLYTPSEEFYRNNSFIKGKIDFFLSKYSLGISFILGMFRFWSLSNAGKNASYWKKLGFFFGGPLVTRFCYYLHDQAREVNPSSDKVFFLGRDGDIMSKVYRLLFPEAEAVNLLVSRRVVLLPCIEELDYGKERLFIYHFIEHVSRGEEVADRLGYYDNTSFLNDLRKAKDLSASNLFDILLAHKDWILSKARDERNILLGYLSSVGFLDSNDVVVADTGWGGTIQNALMKLLQSAGIDKKVNGFYMGVGEHALQPLFMGGFLFDGSFLSKWRSLYEIIELLTSSPMDPIIRLGFSETENSYYPISGHISSEEKKRQEVSKEIQEGVLEFVNIIKDRGINVRFLLSDDFYNLFDGLRMNPSSEDFAYLSQLKHAAMIGHKYDSGVLNIDPSCIKA